MTPEQLQTLHAAIFAETDPGFVELRQSGATGAMAEWYSSPADPTYPVWRTDARTADILDAIAFDKYTPTDPPDGTATWTNRALAAQTKQLNLQIFLQGRETVDASKATVRAGLRDAVILVPAGASGANVSPGGSSGVNVMTACTRPALRIEKLLAIGQATTGSVTAALMGYEGMVSNEELIQALYLS